MLNENITRKIDSMGRVSLPKPLREKFGLDEGAEVQLYTHEDKNGNVYICIKTPVNVRERDAEILAKYGFKMPD